MYLSAKDISEMTDVRKVHFLNPRAVRHNRSLGDAAGLRHLGVHMITIAPGDYSTEYHVHHYEEECMYVLSGTGTVTMDKETYKVGPGDFVGYPARGRPHDMLNDGVEPLVCLVIGQRLAQDVADYPRQKKRLYRNTGEWNLVDHDAIEHIKR